MERLGKRQKRLLQLLDDGLSHHVGELVTNMAEIEVKEQGSRSAVAQEFLEASTTAQIVDSAWRTNMHESLKRLLLRKDIIRVEKGWYRKCYNVE